MADGGEVRDIIVTELKKITSGERNGRSYTLYQVRATHADGRVIPSMDLRAFVQLPLQQVIRVRVQPHHSDKWGLSYTLWPVDGERGESRPPAAAAAQNGNGNGNGNGREWTKERLDALARRVIELERRLGEVLRDERPGPTTSEADATAALRRAAEGPPTPTGELPPDPMEQGVPNDAIPF